ncbi:C39 family peptidase [Gordonia sp. ABSL49_1]|uniref:C39 family peptidase n=1 Tax=Gordonia sp. ABSL49_1 TaxID=2920941 RepID=UPI001F0DE14E|nr:C39 family peptidase [Gordonia sp. ABSL49_1]MCH5645174.1 C39 family peptidase [Gordonia sp. ABSL49_1]
MQGDVTLPYDGSFPAVSQDTYYWCGPASTQQALIVRGIRMSERDIAAALGTTENGTNHVGLIANYLNRRLGAPGYVVRTIADPASKAATDLYFDDICRSINAGFGVVDNVMVPPSNYPRGARGENVRYSGGVVYHYRFIAGYNRARREVLVIDSGFSPNVYWQKVDKSATCVAGKGYTACPVGSVEKDTFLPGLTAAQQRDVWSGFAQLAGPS